MYSLESSVLWPDIRDIINSGSKPVRFNYKAQLHTVKEDIDILKLMTIDIVRDYAKQIGDQVHVSFKMPLGDYVYRLYSDRDNIEFTLTRTIIEEDGTKVKPNTKTVVERYKAIFLADKNPNMGGSELLRYDTESLNIRDIVDVQLQLLDRSLEPLRIKTVAGVYKKVTQKKVINNLLLGESQKVQVDGKPAAVGIDIVEPNNTSVLDHVVIPNGTLITALPSYLQESMCGVYNTGIGTYLQTYDNRKTWFVYPLFDHTRFKASGIRAIIYAVPKARMEGINRTYVKDGNILSIAASSDKNYSDSASVDSINKGVGVRLSAANSFMKKPIKITETGPKAIRTQLNTEVATSSRKDGLNYAPSSKSGPSNNPYKEYSQVLFRDTAKVTFTWEHSDPSQIYPGMPCKYVFLDKDKPVELMGTILFIHTYTALQGNGITGNLYFNVSTVTIICETHTLKRDIPKTVTGGL